MITEISNILKLSSECHLCGKKTDVTRTKTKTQIKITIKHFCDELNGNCVLKKTYKLGKK